MVVDDDQYNKIAIKYILQQITNFQILEASNGQQAIQIIEKMAQSKNGTIDYLLIDYNMPIMDGITATRILKQKIREGQLKNFQIILNSADAEFERENFLQAGGDEVCVQPVTLQTLYELFIKLC